MLCLLVALGYAAAAGAQPPAGSTPTLHLASGDSLQGQLRDTDQPDTLRWHSPGFTTPFDFPLSAIRAVHFPGPDQRPKPTGDYCIELVGGDLLFGSLVALSSDEAELDLPGSGRVRVQRNVIRRLLQWRDGADLIYFGPNGLAGWDHSGSWQDDGGHLITDQRGASLYRDLDIPPQASLEFEVSWTKEPNFVLAIGIDQSEESAEQAFRFEVWDDRLVAVRETEHEADVALLEKIASGAGKASFQVFLDQQNNRFFVFSADGKQVADLSVSPRNAKALGGLRLINKGGDLRLEQLRITRASSEPPREVEASKSRIHRADGSIVYGEVKTFDQETGEFLVAADSQETRIREKDVRSVALPSSAQTEPRAVRVVLQNGVRMSGELVKVERAQAFLKSPGVSEPLPFAVAELRTVLPLEPSPPSPLDKGRTGRLELEGVTLHGTLVDSGEDPDQSPLVWHPHGSETASPLRREVSGRIVYKDPPPKKKQTAAQPRRNPGVLGGILRAFSSAQPSTGGDSASSTGESLHLRTGDTIPCEIKQIDETGVTFESSQSDATFVPQEKVKAVELARVANAVKLTRPKLQRLLTLPRIQRDNPPTHLIRSTRGDFLRARLESMNDTTLAVEVRLETKQLRRDDVAQIIWLHEDELESSEQPATQQESSTKMRVQTLRSDESRLTFVPERLSGTTLSGNSEVLGACRVDLEQVDQLLIGGAIQRAAARLEFGRWRLYDAPDPKFATAHEAEGQRLPGTESSLVGKPAPDFELERLEGGKFRLSQQRGKVIVLDFWATWCGPCIQAMPQVEGVVEEFKDRDVQLVAVNLQEGPERIRSMLERLDLDPTVVLDLDGAVAAKYEATAIPQTVIIDSEGAVARLFVGGGSRLGEQLREALNRVLDDGEDADPDAA